MAVLCSRWLCCAPAATNQGFHIFCAPQTTLVLLPSLNVHACMPPTTRSALQAAKRFWVLHDVTQNLDFAPSCAWAVVHAAGHLHISIVLWWRQLLEGNPWSLAKGLVQLKA
jgi:hypothetical protein